MSKEQLPSPRELSKDLADWDKDIRKSAKKSGKFSLEEVRGEILMESASHIDSKADEFYRVIYTDTFVGLPTHNSDNESKRLVETFVRIQNSLKSQMESPAKMGSYTHEEIDLVNSFNTQGLVDFGTRNFGAAAARLNFANKFSPLYAKNMFKYDYWSRAHMAAAAIRESDLSQSDLVE